MAKTFYLKIFYFLVDEKRITVIIYYEQAIKFVPRPEGFRRECVRKGDKNMSKSTQVSAVGQSNPATSTSDTWESRIKTASTFMGLTVQQVEQGLKDMGVEKEPAGLEMLSDENITPFGDIRAVFCDNTTPGYNIPIAKMRMAMKYLRGPKGSQKTDSVDPELVDLKRKYGIKMRVEDIEPAELLEHYHPDQPNHPITTALRKRFGDKKVIVFKPDSKTIDIEATANYIADLEQGFDEEETVESDGVLVRPFSVGQIPNQMIDEDPLFEGKPLKRGRSVVNRVNWTGIELSVRQFSRVVLDRGDIDTDDRFQIQEFMKVASKGLAELKKAFPEADLEYREMAQKNELPKLTLTMESANGKKQDPFGINNRKF